MAGVTEFTSKNQLLLIVLAILASCCLCCGCLMAATYIFPSQPTTAPTTIHGEDSPAESLPTNAEDLPAEVVPETKAATYQSVFKFDGSSSRKSEPFRISGDRYKVVWTLKNKNQYSTFSAYAKKPGGSEFLDTENITLFADDSGETIIYKSGEFYLDISSANTSWVVEVFDYK